MLDDRSLVVTDAVTEAVRFAKELSLRKERISPASNGGVEFMAPAINSRFATAGVGVARSFDADVSMAAYSCLQSVEVGIHWLDSMSTAIASSSERGESLCEGSEN